MNHVATGLIIIGVGVWVIANRKQFTHDALEFQRKFFGLKFTERTEAVHVILAVPFGVLFIAIGLVGAFGISVDIFSLLGQGSLYWQEILRSKSYIILIDIILLVGLGFSLFRVSPRRLVKTPRNKLFLQLWRPAAILLIFIIILSKLWVDLRALPLQ